MMLSLITQTSDMERAEILTALRGDTVKGVADKDANAPLYTKDGVLVGDWSEAASRRFPENFRKSVPDNAQVSTMKSFHWVGSAVTNVSSLYQNLILWCLERNPLNRPSGKWTFLEA
jgi:hypothetical protein